MWVSSGNLSARVFGQKTDVAWRRSAQSHCFERPTSSSWLISHRQCSSCASMCRIFMRLAETNNWFQPNWDLNLGIFNCFQEWCFSHRITEVENSILTLFFWPENLGNCSLYKPSPCCQEKLMSEKRSDSHLAVGEIESLWRGDISESTRRIRRAEG